MFIFVRESIVYYLDISDIEFVVMVKWDLGILYFRDSVSVSVFDMWEGE